MAAGSKLSIVTTIPAHPAQVIGCKSRTPFGGAWGIKSKPERTRSKRIQLVGIKFNVVVSGGVGAGTKSIKPMALRIIAIMKPAKGPLAPTSNNASLFRGRDFCIITAPKVPSGGGPGMKYGEVASILFLFAVNL